MGATGKRELKQKHVDSRHEAASSPDVCVCVCVLLVFFPPSSVDIPKKQR